MDSDYLFFLSYARHDRDPLLDEFHDDLRLAVSRKIVHPPDRVSFYDRREIDPGAEWPEMLLHALQRSRVLVCLYSPWYFSRENCGREWELFRLRSAAYERMQGLRRDIPAILPILWLPRDRMPRQLPAVVADIQFTHDEFGEEYAEEGLRHMKNLRVLEDQYKMVLDALAERIVKYALAPPLPVVPDVRDPRTLTNAFSPSNPPLLPAQPAQAGIQRIPAPQYIANGGPRFVQYVFVAGKRDELAAHCLRQELESYGEEGGMDWHPYHPEVSDEIARLVVEVTQREGFVYDTLELDAQLIPRLEEARRRNKIVVLIVDTWTLHIDAYQQPLRQFDERLFLNSVVLVPWNNADPETLTYRTRLEDRLKLTFLNRATLRDPNFFVDSIENAEELKAELAAALTRAKMRVINAAEVIKKAESAFPITRPVVAGPGGFAV